MTAKRCVPGLRIATVATSPDDALVVHLARRKGGAEATIRNYSFFPDGRVRARSLTPMAEAVTIGVGQLAQIAEALRIALEIASGGAAPVG